MGMVDEIDGGTQICKVDNDPPPSVPNSIFQSYESLPEDHYRRLTGETPKMPRSPERLTKEMPERERASSPESKK